MIHRSLPPLSRHPGLALVFNSTMTFLMASAPHQMAGAAMQRGSTVHSGAGWGALREGWGHGWGWPGGVPTASPTAASPFHAI